MVKTVGKYDLYGTLGEGAFGKYVKLSQYLVVIDFCCMTIE